MIFRCINKRLVCVGPRRIRFRLVEKYPGNMFCACLPTGRRPGKCFPWLLAYGLYSNGVQDISILVEMSRPTSNHSVSFGPRMGRRVIFIVCFPILRTPDHCWAAKARCSLESPSGSWNLTRRCHFQTKPLSSVSISGAIWTTIGMEEVVKRCT